jgi:glyoxylase-like metal-dependent hydrolase (beta-lactamase superfamily II)
MAEFTEVADRCWVARYPWLDVNVSVIAGDRGLLVVDTNTSTAAARTVLGDLRRISPAPVLHVVNTHQHFDHTFGNGVFAEVGADLVCHDAVVASLPEHAEQVRQQAAEDAANDDRYAEIAATEVVVPGRSFSSALALDLGDRLVELVHPGRGHTDGDVVVRVPDADVLFAGDLVEESAERGHVPGYGDDSWPLDWPFTLDLVLSLVAPDTIVVPGHGAPVGRDFVEQQRADIGVVAETVRGLAGRGVPLDQALGEADWPFPADALEHAVRRGYAQLPRSQRTLPLV